MLNIGWIDFSKEHRSRVLNVLSLLTTKGAVDELGVGVARDRLANILFPGTSTIQTRARYFFLVPWIMRDLEKQQLRPGAFAEQLSARELSMIEVLKKSQEDGVIGGRAGESLKRKPSDIYWNGLSTYGIFRHRGLTLMQYIQIAGKLSKEKTLRKQMISTEEGSGEDLYASGTESIGPSWHVPEPPANWEKELPMQLSREEALFLREKIMTAPGSRNSLWAEILRNHRKDALNCKAFVDLEPLVYQMPFDLKREYLLARDFAHIIHGAHIRYNVIFFREAGIQQRRDELESAWRQWVSDMQQFDFDSWDDNYLFYKLNLRDMKTRRFIRDWIEIARDARRIDTDELDRKIVFREESIKGRDRCKLRQAKEMSHTDISWIGIGLLQYRWPNAKVILKDIVDGEDNNA